MPDTRVDAPIRKIIHIDMDAFFASVEQRDNPEYRGKPLVVGGEGPRGVVAAASYEARTFGIHSAMPSRSAVARCPDLIFIRPRFDVYREVSGQIRAIFLDYTVLVEPLSIDEAYLDVTQNRMDLPSATLIAREIKRRIRDTTKLTASAGISTNKFLAKVASDLEKPDGLTVIPPDMIEQFIEDLPVGKIPGVGRVTEKKMKKLRIYSGGDLRRRERAELIRHFGKSGSYFFDVVRCRHENPVVPDRIRKSVGAERTFETDIVEVSELYSAISRIAEILSGRMKISELRGRTVTMKIRYNDFKQHTRSRTMGHYVEPEELRSITEELISVPDLPSRPVRLIGISISNLDIREHYEHEQLTLGF